MDLLLESTLSELIIFMDTVNKDLWGPHKQSNERD